MIETLPQTRSTLARAHHASVRADAAASGFRAANIAILAALVSMAADILLPLPTLIRALLALSLAAYGALHAVRLLRARRSTRVPLERAARLVEERHPEMENALINAVQFEAEVAPDDDSPHAALMRREMERAEQAAIGLRPDETADRAPARRAMRRFLLALAATAVSIALLPRVWRFEAPRFLLFWQDHPPFTLTDFTVSPGDTHVKIGGSVPIMVKVGGLAPESLSLVVRDRAGERVTPLIADDPATYSQTLEALTDDSSYYIRADTGRSNRYRIHVDRAPEVRAIKATLTPPAYAGKERTTEIIGKRGIAGLNGTVAELEIEATRPLQSGRLTITAEDGSTSESPLIADPARPEISRARFIITRDAAYRIDLRSADGLERRDAARGRIALHRDEKPLVYLTAPRQNAVVSPDMRIAIRAEAEDDVALRRIEVHRIVNDMADHARSFPADGRRAEAALTLDLKDLGARPGDVIQYYATAYDNDPGRPNLTDSDRYWLWVVSREDYARILRQQRDLPKMAAEYRALTDALRSVAERQRALANRAESGGEIRQEQAALRREARELADAMRALAKQPPQADAERGLQRKLSELAGQVAQAESGAMKQAESSSSSSDAARGAREAAAKLAAASGQGQQSVEKALQAMERIEPLYEDIAHLQELAKRQAELAMQARQAASQVRQDAYQRSRLAELASRQAETKELLAGVRQKLEEHAAQCGADAPSAARQARGLARALDSLGVSEQMASASSAFSRQQAEEGAARAETARRSLERLFQPSRAAQAACKSGLDKQLGLCLGQGAGDSLRQLSRGLGTRPGLGGQGMAQGQGGIPAPRPGSRPGDSGASGGEARQVAAFTALPQQAGRSDRRENRRHLAAGEAPGTLGSLDVEHAAGPARPPGFAADSAPGRYPAEYRRLVKDYFKSVAGGSK